MTATTDPVPSLAARLTFTEALREQRWDDHRFYHQSRINQSLHFFSAMSFLTAYVFLPFSSVAAAMLGWIVAMCSRQIGHFFFESKGYDTINGTTHEEKESVKVGFNLKRKIVLLSLWVLSPVLIALNPSLFGLVAPATDRSEFLHNLCLLWLALAAGAILFRTIQLFLVRDVQTGLVWATKILTDPFHDVQIYHKAPLYVLKGELVDPMNEWENLPRRA